MISDRAGMRLLDAAYDAGIRHFDVARAYAYGLSEHYLGRFLKARGGEVTVASKYGLLAAKNEALIRLVHKPLRPIVRRLRRARVGAVEQRMSAASSGSYAKAAFTAAEARESLHRSLRALKLDRLDVFLMHEASADDLAREELLDFLRSQVASGIVGCFGVGGEAHRVADLYARRRPYCGVLQFNWSVLGPDYDLPGVQRIHFRTFSKEIDTLRAELAADPVKLSRWSDQVDAPLLEGRNLVAVMLKAALLAHPNSMVLFSSTREENIRFNVEVAEDRVWEPRGRRFLELVRGGG